MLLLWATLSAHAWKALHGNKLILPMFPHDGSNLCRAFGAVKILNALRARLLAAQGRKQLHARPKGLVALPVFMLQGFNGIVRCCGCREVLWLLCLMVWHIATILLAQLKTATSDATQRLCSASLCLCQQADMQDHALHDMLISAWTTTSMTNSKAGRCLPGIVEPLEAAYGLVGGVPVHKEALRLPHSAVPAQQVAGHAVPLTLLGCLPPVLQVTPLQPSLQ